MSHTNSRQNIVKGKENCSPLSLRMQQVMGVATVNDQEKKVEMKAEMKAEMQAENKAGKKSKQ